MSNIQFENLVFQLRAFKTGTMGSPEELAKAIISAVKESIANDEEEWIGIQDANDKDFWSDERY